MNLKQCFKYRQSQASGCYCKSPLVVALMPAILLDTSVGQTGHADERANAKLDLYIYRERMVGAFALWSPHQQGLHRLRPPQRFSMR